jgi:hypothetical protein
MASNPFTIHIFVRDGDPEGAARTSRRRSMSRSFLKTIRMRCVDFMACS